MKICETSGMELKDRRENVTEAQNDLGKLQDLASSSFRKARKIATYRLRKALKEKTWKGGKERLRA